MKVVGIVASNASLSYNRLLLEEVKKRFAEQFELELVDIQNIPLFNQSMAEEPPAVRTLSEKINRADAVMIATPEYNYTIPPLLKSVIEWLSFRTHPFKDKPVMILGASEYDHGTSSAQWHLRQILDAPGVHACVLPGNEFLLGNAAAAFDQNGRLIDEKTQIYLDACVVAFIRFSKLLTLMQADDEMVEKWLSELEMSEKDKDSQLKQ